MPQQAEWISSYLAAKEMMTSTLFTLVEVKVFYWLRNAWLKNDCICPKCAAWRRKRWRAATWPARVRDHCSKSLISTGPL